jgi:hypothetical protein
VVIKDVDFRPGFSLQRVNCIAHFVEVSRLSCIRNIVDLVLLVSAIKWLNL